MTDAPGERLAEDAVGRAAAALCATRRSAGPPLSEIPEVDRPDTLEDAYRVQRAVEATLSAEGAGPAVGFKIGCTTAVMQRYLKIDHPCAGTLFKTGLFEGDGAFARNRLVRPGVECEIAVELGADAPAEGPLTPAALAACVANARASIELVDDRWVDFRAVSTPSLVADHFFNAGCVIGPPVAIDPARLGALKGAMRINGASVGEGVGADILGDPMAALAWLAAHGRARGRPLRAGDLVLLGSLVQTHWIEAGDEVVVEIEALGSCALRLTP